MKLYILDFGTLSAELGWFFEAGNVATLSQKSPTHEWRTLKMIGVLIHHPKDGLILYEVGPAPNWKEIWPKMVQEVFPIIEYSDSNRLDVILSRIGYSIKDISAIIIGHAHLDHAGGLEYFRNTNIPIYIHEEELKYMFYAVATKEDYGAYLPHYVDPSFNWKAIHEPEIELFDNIILYHVPGHTPGTMAMRVDLKKDGTFLFTTDLAFFKENFEEERPQGWLLRDMKAWRKSIKKMKAIAKKYNAKVIPGHDAEVFKALKHPPEYYE